MTVTTARLEGVATVPEGQIERHLKSWDDVFARRAWGRYPPEELVRFMGRRFGTLEDKSGVRVLEVGCGPGANLWFLAREGFTVAGIDGSPTAIRQATERLLEEGLVVPDREPDLRVGNFAKLPWKDGSFDAVIDIEGIAHNERVVICDALAEALRVLKPGGLFFAKMFGTQTTGYDPKAEFEPGTLRAPADGPCAGHDLVHFFTDAGAGRLRRDRPGLGAAKRPRRQLERRRVAGDRHQVAPATGPRGAIPSGCRWSATGAANGTGLRSRKTRPDPYSYKPGLRRSSVRATRRHTCVRARRPPRG